MFESLTADSNPGEAKIPQDNGALVHKLCNELSSALEGGKMGDIVAKHEQLILHYYKDVQDQAKESFETAKQAAIVGFLVLIGTILYVLIFDCLSRIGIAPTPTGESLVLTGVVGLVSGAVMEFIAAVSFFLYSRGAKQFGAFHICLERTHRYLLAYKIAEQIEEGRDQALRDLACIMANASMITRQDVEYAEAGKVMKPKMNSASIGSTYDDGHRLAH